MKTLILVLFGLLLSTPAARAWDCYALASDACDLPAEFSHTASVEESGIRVTLASTGADFVPGDTIEFRLLFENVGSEYFCMNWGYMPIDFVYALPSGCSSLADPCSEDAPWYYPGNVSFAPGAGVGLNPGDCRVFSYAWDTTVRPASPGNYDVLGGLFEASFDPAVGEFRMPSTGVGLTITVGPAVPTERSSSGILKARFH